MSYVGITYTNPVPYIRWLGLVFKSPVWSGFLMPQGFNHNHNWSAFSPEVKRLNQTTKRLQIAVFCSL
ncbi:uncharacterized protein LACBIDRAFT_307282 [Laccaria bicolor S238N-H82]|uniref:Predicted protein n=1 Tax=Laccaria bicolor (strain S238N-H82 / ATCC MYA-4686) TaxID=486041 RepID=B0DPT6_LACBS|nr:uncharacterized protein LACBIDRAFT_307282 [Laccaria bicolor S238N-H82]EDR03511.1 predicted protein [Laccaria bicolor S238N-H82]|eukprot:XP_001885967.1 predicted protein [Laccaria bicolor S238N-H82]